MLGTDMYDPYKVHIYKRVLDLRWGDMLTTAQAAEILHYAGRTVQDYYVQAREWYTDVGWRSFHPRPGRSLPDPQLLGGFRNRWSHALTGV
jgi:hypothetical protein